MDTQFSRKTCRVAEVGLVEVPASPPVRTSELLSTSMKCASLSTRHTSPSPQSMPATHTDHETVMDAKYCTARGTDVPESKSRVYGFRRRGIGAVPVSHADAYKSLQI